jgi:predicted small metal-binding protein
MARVVRCPSCGRILSGAKDEDVIRKAVEHNEKDHGKFLTKQDRDQLRAQIMDDKMATAGARR